MLVDSEDQHWFKRTHVEKFWGIEDIRTSLIGLEKCEMLTRQGLETIRRTTDKFLSVYGVMYVIVNSQKDKGKALKEHIPKDIVPCGLDARLKRCKNSIDKPSKNKTTGYWLSNMRTWHCKHKEMFIRYSCIDVKIKSMTNRHVHCGNDPGKDNIIMVIEKDTTHEEDEF